MFPKLFTIPLLNWPIHTYGLLIVTGFLLALYCAYRQAERIGHYANDVLDFGFWALVGGLIGSRVLFIAVEWRDFFILEPWTLIPAVGIKIPSIFAIWKGGLVIWGGILGGFVALYFFCRKRSIRMWEFADMVVLGVPLAQTIGRLGCLAAGCCYGHPVYHLNEAGQVIADLPLAMRFPPGSMAYSGMLSSASPSEVNLMQSLGTTVPLFPSQLAEAFGTMFIFAVLLLVYRRKWFHGQVIIAYAALYSVVRSALEILRGDDARGFVIDGVLSTSQFISLIVVLFAIIGSIALRNRSRSRATN